MWGSRRWDSFRTCLQIQIFGYVLDEPGTAGAECNRKMAGAIRSLVNVRDLQLECARVLHETLIVPVLVYGREKIL